MENAKPFNFGCSTLPFGAMEYEFLVQWGNRYQAFLDETDTPETWEEKYIVRCVHHEPHHDTHQCWQADALRRLLERRTFEQQHSPPGPDRTWIRTWELRDGMILFLPQRPAVLLTREPNPERRRNDGEEEYRNAPDLPWHEFSDGKWRVVTCLTKGKRSEIFLAANDMFEVADRNERTMNYVWRNDEEDDMLILDPDSNQAYHIPPDRISRDICEMGPLRPDWRLRVQFWQGEPLWVWGLA